MKKKALSIGIAALLTVLAWHFLLRGREESIDFGFGDVDVLCAARDIPPHRSITADLLGVRKIPRRFIEPTAIREKETAKAMKRVRGKVSAASIPEGSQITEFLLREPSAKETGVAPMLSVGKRGYVMRLGNLEVAKLLLPGDHIDILATLPDADGGRTTYTILQNILIVAIDKDIIESRRGDKKEVTEGRVLTLALVPEEAQRLAHAQIESQGNISFVIRPTDDSAPVTLPPISATNLLTQQK